MRKLMRSVARATMEAQGITGYNKQRRFTKQGKQWVSSYFAETWRKYLTPKEQQKARADRIKRAAQEARTGKAARI